MLKFGIRQAGGCGRRPKNAKPITASFEGFSGFSGFLEAPGPCGGVRERPGKRPKGVLGGVRGRPGGPGRVAGGVRGFLGVALGPTGQPSPGGGLENAEIWDPPGRGLWTEAKKTRNPPPNQTQKKAPRPPRGPPEAPRGPRRRPEAPRRRPERPAGGLQRPQRRPKTRKCTAKTRAPEAPESPPKAPEAPGRFRSSEGHDRKSPQPFRKILKRYRSARDKTLDQSQADKGGSGNLGRQPETRKGIKLGGCLRKQGVGKRNQHTSSWFVAHERCAVA